ncbi:hypothetical protein RMN57_09830 [Kitasatospora sp. CM 4170]|uniref:Uncharacterized protein n=1 Tax=Kitasatospora aburaviensis TaxID=67265 RepID=A0ABW1F1C6_9ACTN|nr:hypothetical protein [Kitasatospora sp. CM 4170]WNM44996.1 hypothetical protein RMN57_09830 [Kitasatospora sp. CM 4170]
MRPGPTCVGSVALGASRRAHVLLLLSVLALAAPAHGARCPARPNSGRAGGRSPR